MRVNLLPGIQFPATYWYIGHQLLSVCMTPLWVLTKIQFNLKYIHTYIHLRALPCRILGIVSVSHESLAYKLVPLCCRSDSSMGDTMAEIVKEPWNNRSIQVNWDL